MGGSCLRSVMPLLRLLAGCAVLILGILACSSADEDTSPPSNEVTVATDSPPTTIPPEVTSDSRTEPLVRVVEVVDKLHDCRVVGRDTGERCDAGADLRSMTLVEDDGRLVLRLELTEPPPLESGIEWTVQFFAELHQPVICGLSNVATNIDEGATQTPPVTTPISYAIDPVTRNNLDPGLCAGRLAGSTVQFSVDAAAQPPDAEFRMIGSVKLDFPGDPTQLGSEDDFLLRATREDLTERP